MFQESREPASTELFDRNYEAESASNEAVQQLRAALAALENIATALARQRESMEVKQYDIIVPLKFIEAMEKERQNVATICPPCPACPAMGEEPHMFAVCPPPPKCRPCRVCRPTNGD